MPDANALELAHVRLRIAEERIEYADGIMRLGDYKTVANRAYYAVFASMRSVLALDGYDSKKHSGIISEFRKKYLKTEILPKELSEIIDSLVEIRQGSDYDDFYVVSEEEVAEQLKNAKYFVEVVAEYIRSIQ